ncbi:MAG: phosphoglyceromutase, partial [Spirosomaceae bacterium]|nr:phosphoglyceromutase [Spirosomataceae bacterium]
MKKVIYLLLLSLPVFAQNKTENIFIITTDGLRWQEVFGGVDSMILKDDKFVRNRDRIKNSFVAKTPEESRQKLMPFVWNTVAKEGQI